MRAGDELGSRGALIVANPVPSTSNSIPTSMTGFSSRHCRRPTKRACTARRSARSCSTTSSARVVAARSSSISIWPKQCRGGGHHRPRLVRTVRGGHRLTRVLIVGDVIDDIMVTPLGNVTRDSDTTSHIRARQAVRREPGSLACGVRCQGQVRRPSGRGRRRAASLRTVGVRCRGDVDCRSMMRRPARSW